MTVEHPPLGEAIVEQCPPTCEEPVCQPLDVGLDRVVEHPGPERFHLREAVVPTGEQSVPGALGGDVRAARGVRVECRKQPRQSAQRDRDLGACADQGGQPGRWWHPPHHHGRLSGPAGRIGDLSQPEIDVRGEPTVQVDLAPARTEPQLRCAEVEKTVPNRFLDLVCAVAHQEHHADVRLVDGGERALVPVHRSPDRERGGDRTAGPLKCHAVDTYPIRPARPPCVDVGIDRAAGPVSRSRAVGHAVGGRTARAQRYRETPG